MGKPASFAVPAFSRRLPDCPKTRGNAGTVFHAIFLATRSGFGLGVRVIKRHT